MSSILLLLPSSKLGAEKFLRTEFLTQQLLKGHFLCLNNREVSAGEFNLKCLSFWSNKGCVWSLFRSANTNCVLKLLMQALDYKQWVESHNLVIGQVSAWLLTDMCTERAACACTAELSLLPSASHNSHLSRGNASHTASWKSKAGEMSSV